MEPTTWVSHGHLRSIPMLMATRAPWASRAQRSSPGTACHREQVQSPENALNQLCSVNKGKLPLWHKPPGSPSAEAATAKQLLPKSSPRQLRSSFLLSAGHGSTASTISHAVLKRLILIKLYKGHFLAMQSKARFSLLYFCPSDRERFSAFILWHFSLAVSAALFLTRAAVGTVPAEMLYFNARAPATCLTKRTCKSSFCPVIYQPYC